MAFFIPNLNILKSKIKKNILTKLNFRQFHITRKLELQGSFCLKDSNPVFSRIRIRLTQKDRIRPDPDPQHWLKLLKRTGRSLVLKMLCNYIIGCK